MMHPVLLCCKCSNKGMSLMAHKASLQSRHLRKRSFLTLPWRTEEVAAGFQLYSLFSVISISDNGAEAVVLLQFSNAAYIADCHVTFFSPQIRILGFRRAPLVVGRFVNLRTEIKPVATEQLLGTFMTVGKWIPWVVQPREEKTCLMRKRAMGIWQL